MTSKQPSHVQCHLLIKALLLTAFLAGVVILTPPAFEAPLAYEISKVTGSTFDFFDGGLVDVSRLLAAAPAKWVPYNTHATCNAW